MFIIAQVLPTGDCGENFARMAGYLMDLEGNIVHRYGDKETGAIQETCWKSSHGVLDLAIAQK